MSTNGHYPQPMVALAKANAVRLARAQDKRRLNKRLIQFSDLDLTADHLRTMKVLTMLACLPWQRTARNGKNVTPSYALPKRLMKEMGLPESATFGALSRSRQEQLRQVVAQRCPTQRGAKR